MSLLKHISVLSILALSLATLSSTNAATRSLAVLDDTGAPMAHSARNVDITADSRFIAVSGYLRDSSNTIVRGVAITDLELQETTLVANPETQESFLGQDPTIDMSLNGKYIAMQFESDPITSDGSDQQFTYLYNVLDGSWTPLTTPYTGTDLSGCSSVHRSHAETWMDVSGNGVVAFHSTCDNLVATDTNDTSDVFVFDSNTNETTLISHIVGDANATANSESINPRISDDGRYVVYAAKFWNGVDACHIPAFHTYLYDRITGLQTRLSSCDERSSDPKYVQHSISGDGSTVFFRTSQGAALYHIPSAQKEEFEFDLGTAFNGYRKSTQLSYDGRYLAYFSINAYDQNGVQQFDLLDPNSSLSFDYLTLWDIKSGKKSTISTHWATGLPIDDHVHNEVAISAGARHIVYGINDPSLWLAPADREATAEYGLYQEGADKYASNYPYVTFRGTENGWQTIGGGMHLIADNLWQAVVDVNALNSSFKLDIGGVWTDSLDFGDANNDGVAELGGPNISFNEGAGRYRIIFNDDTLVYSVSKLTNAPASSVNLLVSSGSVAQQAMVYQGENVWEGMVDSASAATTIQFENASSGGAIFGDSNSDGKVELQGAEITLGEAGRYLVRYYELSGIYTSEKLKEVPSTREPVAPAFHITDNQTHEITQPYGYTLNLSNGRSIWHGDGSIASLTMQSDAFSEVVTITPEANGWIRFLDIPVVEVGEFPVYLEASANYNGTELHGSTEFMLTVTTTQVPLVVDAGNDVTVTIGQQVIFNGANSSGAFLDTDMQWTSVAFNGAVLVGQSPSYVFDALGSFDVELRIFDDYGVLDTDVVTVTVEEEAIVCDNNYSTMNIRGHFNSWAALPMTLNESCEWTANITTSNTTNNAFKFDVFGNWQTNFGDTNSDGVANQGGSNIAISGSAGQYIVRFNDVTKAYQVTPNQGPMEPIAVVNGDSSVLVGEALILSGAASHDIDGSIVSYLWEGELVQSAQQNQSEITLSSVQPGDYVVTLTVTDNEGLVGSSEFSLSVIEAPVCNAVYNSMVVRGTFNSWATTPMSLNAHCEWQAEVEVASGSQMFKFDVFSNWQTNFGDSNNDGVANQGGSNISFSQGAGTYLIVFNDSSKTYTVTKD